MTVDAKCSLCIICDLCFKCNCCPAEQSPGEQQQEANRIYHEHQNIEYAALQEALASSKWQEAIAVQFDTSDDPSARFTHPHRLIWDIFGPFYNRPSQQRVGTPRKLFDGGKWMCGVQQLL